MTRDEFKVIIKGLKAAYADPRFIPDQDAFDIWYEVLKDLPYDVASAAAQAYIQSETYFPTPASIRKYAVQVTTKEDISELEAWNMVYKAMSNIRDGNAKAEFDKLPAVIQKALGNPASLREMSVMDIETVNTVEQSHFIRAYRTALEREKKTMQLHPSLRQIGERYGTDGLPEMRRT